MTAKLINLCQQQLIYKTHDLDKTMEFISRQIKKLNYNEQNNKG